MTIIGWLNSLGISLERDVLQVAKRSGALPLQWPAGPTGSVIYRLPRDVSQRASMFASTQPVVVNEGEVALVLEDGRAHGVLDPGRYVFERARITGSLDVIWIKTGQQTLKWGIGNVTSSDGIQLSAMGMMYIRVADATLFNAELIQGAMALAEVDIQRFLLPRIQGVLRSTLACWAALDLQAQRDVFAGAVKASLGETFAKMGVGITDLEVVEINFPPEFKAVIAQAAMAGHSGTAALIEAQKRAQVLQLDSAAEAQALLTTGMAQVQLMATMQAHGIDPLKLKALDALNTLAAHPGGAIVGDPRVGLIGQVALSALAQPVSSAPAPLQPLHAQLPATSATPATQPTGETPAEVERQIDNLVERLSEGKISEETYNKLVGRLEAKLTRLRSPGA